MKYIYIVILALIVKNSKGQADEKATWMLRANQFEIERLIFKELTNGTDNTFPKGMGLLSKSDTIKYATGNLFRTCEVLNKRLHGKYQLYYPNGQLYLLRKYKFGYLSDTSVVYSDKGEKTEETFYVSENKNITNFYKGNLIKRKRIDVFDDTPSDFKGGYKNVNKVPKETIIYFDSSGKEISKEEYDKLYPNDMK